MVPRKQLHNKFALFLKRLIDIILSFILIVALLPLLIVLSIVVIVESGWPFIYKRKVVGKDGASFFAYKFRTMVKDADTILKNNPDLNNEFIETFKLKKDPRITKIGYFLRKYSVDELPQLINVLRGQMSIVGPRMMTTLELQEYGEYKKLVLSVKPGLTGLWQISGRQNVSFQRRMELDIAYVNNWTLWKDIIILFQTIFVVLKAEGAY